MTCNGNCPYRPPYGGPPWPNSFQPSYVPQPRENEDPIEYLKRVKRHIKDAEEMFKADKPADNKPKKKESFTFLETFGLLMVGGLFVGIAQMKLIAYFAASLQQFPH